MAKTQILALQKMILYYKDPSLREMRQKECREVCMAYWDIPDLTRRTFSAEFERLDNATRRFTEIQQDYNICKCLLKKIFLFLAQVKNVSYFD